jgi:hypothetical protein
MPRFGNPNSFVGLTIDLRGIGPLPITIGTGILGLVGTSTRGPVSEAMAIGMPSDAKSLYYSGDLKEAIELGFGQGVPVIYAVRVLGSGYAKATLNVDDGLTPATNSGTINAVSEGAWGNAVVVKIEDGDYNATDVEIFPGDGTVGPFALQHLNLVESSANYVKVDGVPRNIVYTEGALAAGKAYVNKTDGTITFYAGEGPAATSLISASIKYKTKKITLTDNESTEVFNNIKDLVFLESALEKSTLVRFTPAAGSTHLPENQNTTLASGSDGSAITTDDWEDALELLGNTITPTTVAITGYEVTPASYDLVPVLDAWLTYMARLFKPCLGFVAAKENETVANLLELASGYNNQQLSIVGNGWDQSTPRRNLAVARAAKEAAVALGESTADPINSLNGVNDLLTTFNQDEMDALTRGGVDVIQKQRGIKPYVGISTATDWQFMRCVDNRTINWVIVAAKFITDGFYHKRRTAQTLNSVKASIDAMLEEQKILQNIERYATGVFPDSTDTGRVNIELLMQNIGHIERFRAVMGVGILPA